MTEFDADAVLAEIEKEGQKLLNLLRDKQPNRTWQLILDMQIALLLELLTRWSEQDEWKDASGSDVGTRDVVEPNE